MFAEPGVKAAVDAVKAALVAPAGTVTLAGTVATVASLLESVTTAPPAGAAALRVTVPIEELSLKVVDERERRRTLLGKLNTTPQRPGATRGERYATCAEAYHCEDGSTGGAPGRGDAR